MCVLKGLDERSALVDVIAELIPEDFSDPVAFLRIDNQYGGLAVLGDGLGEHRHHPETAFEILGRIRPRQRIGRRETNGPVRI